MSLQGRKDGTSRVADLDRLFLRGKLLLRRARLGRWLLSVYYRAEAFLEARGWSREDWLARRYDVRLRYLNVELTSYCNLRCKWCPISEAGTWGARANGFMDPEVWRGLLEQIYEGRRRGDLSIGKLAVWNAGEVMMHPKFDELIGILGEVRQRAGGFPFVSLLTNATKLTPERARTIIESGALDLIQFSVDGGTQETFETIRVRAKWKDVLGNIRGFLDERDRLGQGPQTGIIMIDVGEDPESEFDAIVERVDVIERRRAHNWSGSTEFEDLQVQAPKTGRCKVMEQSMSVLWDGRVSPCCNDLLGEHILGDLGSQTLAEIFQAAPRVQLEAMLSANRRGDVELCKNCSLG